MKSTNLSLRISIRLKITLLICFSLAVGLGAYLFICASIIVEDKTSYLYDYHSTALQAVARSIEDRLTNVGKATQILGTLTGPEAERAFFGVASGFDVAGLVYLRARVDGHFDSVGRFGPQSDLAWSEVSTLGWNAAAYDRAVGSLMIGDIASGKWLPVGGKVTDETGHTLAYLALLTLDPSLLAGFSREAELVLAQPDGRLILSREGNSDHFSDAQIASLQALLPAAAGATGVRGWESGGISYLVVYRRLAQDKLLLLSFIPRALAMRAAESLASVSFRIGGAILLIAFALALLWAKGMTSRLRQIAHASLRIGEGDFSTRLGSREPVVRDEVSDLAHSFNIMSEKVTLLIEETAMKARMEKELETAQAFQSKYFPKASFEAGNVRLSGIYRPATECAGDWWFYARLEDYLVILLGDVTGHGVSAALVTAQVHGVATQWLSVKKTQGMKEGRELGDLVERLNAALLETTEGDSGMTFLAAALKLSTGELTLFNCSHPWPYRYRRPDTISGSRVYDSVQPLRGETANPLGERMARPAEPAEFNLHPGDRVLFCTDGIFDLQEQGGRKIRRKKLLSYFREAVESNAPGFPLKICQALLDRLEPLLGAQSAEVSDDVTVVVLEFAEQSPLQEEHAESPSKNRTGDRYS